MVQLKRKGLLVMAPSVCTALSPCLQCPAVISEEMPMERVVEMFRKMGLRQVLVTRNG